MKASNLFAIVGILVLLGVIGWMCMGMMDSFRETVKDPNPVLPPSVSTRRVVSVRPYVRTIKPKKLIIDSVMASPMALGTSKFPSSVTSKMELVTVSYLGFDGVEHQGQIVVEKSLTREVKEIFNELRKINFPIEKVAPVAQYRWDDQLSMKANNTSAFNYRKQVMPSGRSVQALSKHSLGRAIDLNPRINPYVGKNGKSVFPYNPSAKGTLTKNSKAVKIFTSRGWQWGGNWSGAKDYQHFVKP